LYTESYNIFLSLLSVTTSQNWFRKMLSRIWHIILYSEFCLHVRPSLLLLWIILTCGFRLQWLADLSSFSMIYNGRSHHSNKHAENSRPRSGCEASNIKDSEATFLGDLASRFHLHPN
jgi:hypothetical protein